MKKVVTLILALALCAGLSAPVCAAGATPLTGSNVHMRAYSFYSARPIASYLFANDKGGLTRVEGLTVEEYNSSFQLLNTRKIPQELTIYGGFYAGSQYNFFIFGQSNDSESPTVEVIRVVKYSKDWKRLGQASLYDIDTTVPFRAGSLRCTESNGFLYIHTCHQKYTYADGKRHQSNLTAAVEEETMKCQLTNFFYVSHSFDQYILADRQGNLITADLGDAYPYRAINLHRLPAGITKVPEYNALTPELTEIYNVGYKQISIHDIPGTKGQNSTGIVLGGLAETTSGYWVAYTNRAANQAGQNYFIYVDKSTMTPREIPLTAQPGASAPAVVSTGPNGGYVMWNGRSCDYPDSTLYYAAYSDGGTVGPVQTAKAYLSPCQPIIFNGKVVWYVTNGSVPVFYTLDASGLKAFPASAAPGASVIAGPGAASVPKPNTPPSTKTMFDGDYGLDESDFSGGSKNAGTAPVQPAFDSSYPAWSANKTCDFCGGTTGPWTLSSDRSKHVCNGCYQANPSAVNAYIAG